MQINSNVLIDELIVITQRCLRTVQPFNNLTAAQLNYKETSEKWSVLECLEHLNLYGDFYLPEIQKRILASPKVEAGNRLFKSGVLGNYFANLMKENNGKIKKMKSPKDKNPANSSLSVTTLDRFIKQTELLISLLEQARNTDLIRTRTAISLSSLIKLRLGDTFRFYVYHIERHVVQAEKVQVPVA